jgi:glycosyltransferase involved in cell wall biosynthesis
MDDFNPTLISIATPGHNAAAHLEDAIWSVPGQGYPHGERIMVDHDSTDGSTETLQRLATVPKPQISPARRDRSSRPFSGTPSVADQPRTDPSPVPPRLPQDGRESR